MALIECPQCGHKISSKAHRCPKCGNIQQPVHRPTNIVSSETKYAQIDNQQHKDYDKPPHSIREHGSRKPLLPWLIAAIVVIIGLFTWFFLSRNDTQVQNNLAIDNASIQEEEYDSVAPPPAVVEEVAADEVEADEAVSLAYDGDYSLSGKINNKYPIRIWVTINGNMLSGKYCYLSTIEKYGDTPSSYITINGQINSIGEISFTGSSATSSTTTEWAGSFNGNYLSAKKIGKDEEMTAYTFVEEDNEPTEI